LLNFFKEKEKGHGYITFKLQYGDNLCVCVCV